MKTIILCGGIGYRLKEETEFRPKPMVQIGGKPMLWHIMKIYEHHGYNDFIIALGYKGDDIKDYFLNQRFFQYDFTLSTRSRKTHLHKANVASLDNFNITFVSTGLESATGERIRRVKEYVEHQPFMVTYGDGVTNVDIKKIVRFHKKKGVIATITGVHPYSRWGLVRQNKKNFVTTFRQKPVLNEYINGGFMVFEPEIFNFIKPNEMIEVALERLARKRQLALFTHDGFWHAMDHYHDVDELNKLWKQNAPWKVW